MDRIRHLIAVLPLAATLTLTSCFSSPLNGSSDDTPATVAPTSQGTGSTSARTTAAASIALPDPVSGTYNGQTVTMEYTVLTNQDISLFNSGSFHNGYAQVLFQEKGEKQKLAMWIRREIVYPSPLKPSRFRKAQWRAFRTSPMETRIRAWVC